MPLALDEGWVLLKIPRGDINGVGEDEVTGTSGHTHKQKEQTNKQRREGYIERETLVFTQNTARQHQRGVFNRSEMDPSSSSSLFTLNRYQQSYGTAQRISIENQPNGTPGDVMFITIFAGH